jgi:hypothetical protein
MLKTCAVLQKKSDSVIFYVLCLLFVMPRTCAVSPETGVNELLSKQGKELFEYIFSQTVYLPPDKALHVFTQFYPMSGVSFTKNKQGTHRSIYVERLSETTDNLGPVSCFQPRFEYGSFRI